MAFINLTLTSLQLQVPVWIIFVCPTEVLLREKSAENVRYPPRNKSAKFTKNIHPLMHLILRNLPVLHIELSTIFLKAQVPRREK